MILSSVLCLSTALGFNGETKAAENCAKQRDETAMVRATTPETAPRQASHSIVSDPRWARVLERDRTADGLFWYSVATTGVYCRPSCPSRAANPKNVQMHVTLA